MKFIDEAKIEVSGGRGGSVFAVADENVNTLVEYRFVKK